MVNRTLPPGAGLQIAVVRVAEWGGIPAVLRVSGRSRRGVGEFESPRDRTNPNGCAVPYETRRNEGIRTNPRFRRFQGLGL
jgi:hypothetical protein